eukprot:301972_1
MSSLHGNKDLLIASGPVGNDDNTSWFDDADVAGQINSSMGEGVSNEWRAKERVLSWTRQAFGSRPRNIALPASSEVAIKYFENYDLSVSEAPSLYEPLVFKRLAILHDALNVLIIRLKVRERMENR